LFIFVDSWLKSALRKKSHQIEAKSSDFILNPAGGGGTPYSELNGEALPKRGAFFKLTVY